MNVSSLSPSPIETPRDERREKKRTIGFYFSPKILIQNGINIRDGNKRQASAGGRSIRKRKKQVISFLMF
jgi:hypothetical protein